MPTVTLFEHQRRPYADLGWDGDHPALAQLEQLNEDAGAELIHLGRTYLRATQFVGVIRVGETTLQILPKIDYERAGSSDALAGSIPFQIAVDSAARNFLYLLSYAQDLQIKRQDTTPLLAHRSDWFELLTRLLAAELHRQMKQGLHRSYVQLEETLRVIRGRWQLDRQLTRRPHVRHLFDVTYDDFSPDTLLNRIFQYVVGCLLFHSQEPGNRRLLRDLSKWLVDVEQLGEIPQADLDSMHFTRLTERFRPAFNLARLFVENRAFQLAAGGHQTFAFVFDMNRLFEKFVYGFIARHRRQILTDGWGGVRVREQAKGRPTYLAEKLPGGQRVFQLSPDILFTRPSGRAVLILDTKYKELADGQRKQGVSESDMYQMLAYAVALDCRQTLLLYPQQAGSPPILARFEMLGYPNTVIAATINLRRPLDRPDELIQELNNTLKEVCHSGPHLRA